MWSRSARWERRLRLAMASLGLVALLVLPWLAPESARPPALVGALVDSLGLLLHPADRELPLEAGDYPPARLEGTPVYERATDGKGLLVGSVERRGDGLVVVLPPAQAERYRNRAVLLRAEPARDLVAAVELLLAPDTIEEEIGALRERLDPVLEEVVFPLLEAGIRDSLKRFLSEMLEQDQELLGNAAGELFDALKGEFKPLAKRLVKRAFFALGLVNVARCIWNKGRELVENGWAIVGSMFGDDENVQLKTYECLTDAMQQDLEAALKDELGLYWHDRKDFLTGEMSRVLGKYEAPLIDRAKRFWLPEVKKVGLAAWQASREQVSAAFSEYGAELARRHLTTAEGGPQISLAYLIRTTVGITDRPLLVLQESETAGASLRLVPLHEHVEPLSAEASP